MSPRIAAFRITPIAFRDPPLLVTGLGYAVLVVVVLRLAGAHG